RVRADRGGREGGAGGPGLGAGADGAPRGDAARAGGEAHVQDHRGQEERGLRARPGPGRQGARLTMMQTLTITRPDDRHLPLRDGAEMASVLPYTARAFARAVVMPNLTLPVTDTARAAAYRARILDVLPRGSRFEPLMTLYLTDKTGAAEIARAKRSGF